ncbi:unnamed protein product [Commensalibacter communis]|nr:unnamed protein product [Commensalibacter communis]
MIIFFKSAIKAFFILLLIYMVTSFLQYRSHTSLTRQFYSYFAQHCKEQNKCIVELHKITPFKWDHAYFFSTNDLNIIDQIIGQKKRFYSKISYKDSNVIFIKDNKIVASGIIGAMSQYESSVKLVNIPLYPDYFNSNQIKQNRNNQIIYYHLQPNNDQLFVSYSRYIPSDPPYEHSILTEYTILRSNSKQTYLYEKP